MAGAVLLDKVPATRQTPVPACDQHLGDAFECIADLAEEHVLRAHTAGVLARQMQMLVNLALPGVFGAKLHHWALWWSTRTTA